MINELSALALTLNPSPKLEIKTEVSSAYTNWKPLAVCLPQTNPLGQNRHHFISSSSRDRTTPVVRFGVAKVVEQPDSGLHGMEGAEYEMPDVFGALVGAVG